MGQGHLALEVHSAPVINLQTTKKKKKRPKKKGGTCQEQGRKGKGGWPKKSLNEQEMSDNS